MAYYCEVTRDTRGLVELYLNEKKCDVELLGSLKENSFKEGDPVSQALEKLTLAYVSKDVGELKLLDIGLTRLLIKLK